MKIGHYVVDEYLLTLFEISTSLEPRKKAFLNCFINAETKSFFENHIIHLFNYNNMRRSFTRLVCMPPSSSSIVSEVRSADLLGSVKHFQKVRERNVE